MTVRVSRSFVRVLCVAAITLAVFTRSEVRVQSVPSGPCICSPLLMNIEGDPSQESIQNWHFQADASGMLAIKFITHVVNPEESGSLTATVFDGATVVATAVVPFPTGAAGSENAVNLSFPTTAGSWFRLQVTNPAMLSGRRAHHYRFEAHGASSIAQDSPGIRLQEAVTPQRWIMRVASGEALQLLIGNGMTGPDTPVTAAHFRLVDPLGNVRVDDFGTLPLPRTFSIPTAGDLPGEWRLDLIAATGHFTLDKLSGPDRRLYLTWLSSGYGQFDVAITRNGVPGPGPAVSLLFTNTTTGETFSDSAGGTFSRTMPVGSYTVTASGPATVEPGLIAVDLSCNSVVPLAFDVPNRPPTVSIPGGPFTVVAGGPPINLFAMASDPDGDVLIYEWSIPSGGGSLTNVNGPSTGYSSVIAPSVATVQVTVRDTWGAAASATAIVTVNAPKPPAHLWHADYTMEWNAPRTSADQYMDGVYPFTYAWGFGILNDPVDVLDAPRITVSTALAGLTPFQDPDVTLAPGYPPYVWNGPQLQRAGQGRSSFFARLQSQIAVPSLYQLGFDATRSLPGGQIPAGASELRSFTFTMTARDATLTSMAANVNFGSFSPTPVPVTTSEIACNSASGFVEPFSATGVRWQLSAPPDGTMPMGVQYVLNCSVRLTNTSGSPAVYSPNINASGKRSAPRVDTPGTSVSVTTDPQIDPWDPLGSVDYNVTAPGEVISQFTRHFNRTIFFDGRNQIVDDTPPLTTATVPQPPNAFGWYTQDVQVQLSAIDPQPGSGVKMIHYALNGLEQPFINGSFGSRWITSEGTTTITYWAMDNAGNVETPKTLTIRIDKTRPAVTVAPAFTTPEGSVLLILFQATGTQGETLSLECEVVSGSGSAYYSGGNICTYIAGNGPALARVVIRARDGHGNIGGRGTDVTVTDAPLLILAIAGPTAPLRVGTPATIDVTYNDQVLDTVTCTFDWNDGSESTGVAGSRTACSATHTYASPGVYSVDVTVHQSDGLTAAGKFSYVVVYSPDAGSVTGGGLVSSPAGALNADPALTGRANFGFNAKYQGDQPVGQTEFQFQNGKLNFHSSTYAWLVVTPEAAAYSGTGTINREGSYDFVVVVVDGKSAGLPDRFRIRISDRASGAVVYDSESAAADFGMPTLALDAGSIVIHK